MFASRTATRAVARSARTPLRASRQVRFQTTNQQAAKAGGASGLVGGLAGGGLVFLVSFNHARFNVRDQFKLTTSRLVTAITTFLVSLENHEILTCRETSNCVSANVSIAGAKTIVNAASTSKAQLQKLTQGIQDSAPEPNEALKWLRSTTSRMSHLLC